ncbi:MAG: glutathione synthase [Desulfobacteraceae bacterium]|nr:glutathione synthase [Desulfobacteraceae bacterium]
MILSFHPCYVGDENRLCAGRDPDDQDRARMRAARAVILPQGCRRTLFDAAAANCARVFPDYHARFAWPEKTGQIRLFRNCGLPHPHTAVFDALAQYRRCHSAGRLPAGFAPPFVFKYNGAGEGDNVWRVEDLQQLEHLLSMSENRESTGQYGFLIQEYIDTGGCCLRVAVIGDTLISYWRIQQTPENFRAAAALGAEIDHCAFPALQAAGKQLVRHLCAQTGINLAGVDLIFSETDPARGPLLLEINYFFGRRGLGGSERFYELLCREIDRWITKTG